MGISQDADDPQKMGELLARARAGDGHAFCLLAEPLEQRLFQQAVALCRDERTAEDLVSETLVEAWKSLSRYDESCRFTTWLYAILWHRHQKAVRRVRSRPVSLAALPAREAGERQENHGNLPGSDPSPVESAMHRERDAELRQLIDALPEKHRQVVWLRFFEDISLPEMALVLKCSEGTVKSRMHHALKNLRKLANSMNLLESRGDT